MIEINLTKLERGLRKEKYQFIGDMENERHALMRYLKPRRQNDRY